MSASPYAGFIKPSSARHVTAVLGPTNTGKTHLAIERMLGHESGLIGLPLRLLAREVYDKIVARIGPREVALITGEEKIKPERPRYYVCTVEAMPRDVEVDFLAVDEIQLAADPDRGHVFTDRLFHARGMNETLFLGAQTMAEGIRELIPGANFISRPRLSKLTYAGQKKITRLPSRSAIVAFAANEVYAIAELIRRQRGGAAVVLGALSPRTRNAQVALYQSGDVDFIVATDAVGMGLNLDVDHVAFAGVRKFDGRNHRNLTPAELAQIAGRAGRHLNDGTFGVTADVDPFDQELVNKLENHEFEPLKLLQWRNTQLDFTSVEGLKESLRVLPGHPRLARARMADDLECLEIAFNDARVAELAVAPAAIKRLWEACQIPDYRKVAPASHAELVTTIYKYIMSDEGLIPEDWFNAQVELANRIDGDIDTLSNRIAHIRTWTFVSNRREWLKDPDGWQARTREIEDRLSDALHEQLTERFVDKRTSVLMKSMRDKDTLFAEIEKDGRVVVEKHYVGKLEGFRFTADAAAAGVHGKAARNAAAKVLVHELAARSDRLTGSADTALTLTRDGQIFWEQQEIGRLTAADDALKPGFSLHSDEHLAAGDRDNIVKRIDTWLTHHIEVRLKPLVDIAKAEDVTGLAKGIAFRLKENFGVLKRELVAEEIKSLDQEGRAQLRKYGVRFGAYNIYFPLLLKPAAADLLVLFWLLKHGAEHNLAPDAISKAPRQGLTSMVVDSTLPEAFYRAAGFGVSGPRAVRVDMLERLADIIRPLSTWKPTETNPEPPAGAAGGGAFKIRPEMMSIMGCSGDELGLVLESLGFRREKRLVRKAAQPAPALLSVSADGSPANDNVAPPILEAEDGAHLAVQDFQEAATADVPTTGVALAPGVALTPAVPPISPAAGFGVTLEGMSTVEVPGGETKETAKDNDDGKAITANTVSAETVSIEAASDEAATHGIAGSQGTPSDVTALDGTPPGTVPSKAEATAVAEPEFEEIWRFRRVKPRFEKPEGQAAEERSPRRYDRSNGRDRPPHRSSPQPTVAPPQQVNMEAQSVPAREQAAPQSVEPVAKPHGFRDGGNRDRNNDPRDRNRDRHHGKATAPGAKPDGQSPQRERQQGAAHKGPARDSRDNRGRDNGRPQPQRGQFAASASPGKSGGAIDPDSPFAALSQLKERMEKQVRTQDEAV